MANRNILIRILARDFASPVLSKIGSTLGTLGGIAAAVGAVQFGRQLVQGIRAAIDAAAIQEEAEAKLARAIENTGQSAAASLPQLRAYASALQDQTGVGDELILQNQALLISLGRLGGQELQRATRAALDLSAALGVDQRTAFDLVGKAAAGYTSTLSRYGIILDQNLPQSEKFEAALALIEERFGGQAAARLETFSGRVDEFTGRIGDLQEAIGAPFAQVGREFLDTVLSPIVKRLTEATSETEDFREAIFDTVDDVAAVGQALEIVVRRLVAFRSEIEQFAPLAEGITTFFDALRSQFPALRVVDGVRDGIDALKASIEEFATPSERINTFFGRFRRGAQEAREGLDELKQQLSDPALTSFGDVDLEGFAGLPTESLTSSLQELETQSQATAERVGAALERLESALRRSGRVTQEQATEIAQNFLDEEEAARRAGIATESFFTARARLIVEFAEAAEASGVRVEGAFNRLAVGARRFLGDREAIRQRQQDFVLALSSIEAKLEQTGTVTEEQARRTAEALENEFAAAAFAGVPLSRVLDALEGDLQDLVRVASESGVQLRSTLLGLAELLLDRQFTVRVEPVFEELEPQPPEIPDIDVGDVALSPLLPGTDEFVEQQGRRGLERARAETETFAQFVQERLGAELLQSATAFSDQLVEGAFGARIEWGKFFESVLKGFAKAIAQALILEALIASTGGASGFFGRIFGRAEGGIIPGAAGGAIIDRNFPRFQAGGILPGAGGVDSRLGLFTPGELVVDTRPEEARDVLGGRAAIVPADQIGGGPPININFNPTVTAIDPDAARRNMLPLFEEFADVVLKATRRGRL